MKADHWLWAWLSTSWAAWRMALVIVKPETVLAWHRPGIPLVLKLEESLPNRTTVARHVPLLRRNAAHAARRPSNGTLRHVSRFTLLPMYPGLYPPAC